MHAPVFIGRAIGYPIWSPKGHGFMIGVWHCSEDVETILGHKVGATKLSSKCFSIQSNYLKYQLFGDMNLFLSEGNSAFPEILPTSQETFPDCFFVMSVLIF